MELFQWRSTEVCHIHNFGGSGMRKSQNFGLFIPTEGKGEVQIEEEKWSVKPGMVLFCNPGRTMKCYNFYREPLVYYFVSFDWLADGPLLAN